MARFGPTRPEQLSWSGSRSGRRAPRLSDTRTGWGEWVFAGTRLPIADLFYNLNEGVPLDEFLDWYEVERSAVEAVIDRQMELLRVVRQG